MNNPETVNRHEMFETNTGRQAQVELLESLKRGGNSCRFKITLT